MRFVIFAAALAAFATAAGAQGFDAAALFKRLDANGDGAVSKAEWVAAGRPAERFDATDTDKDGKVTPQELTAAIQRMMQPGGDR